MLVCRTVISITNTVTTAPHTNTVSVQCGRHFDIGGKVLLKHVVHFGHAFVIPAQ